MGCTSSAPNMSNTSTAEKSIQFEDENSDSNSKDVEEIIYRAADEKNVLPSCDNLPEPVHLVRNKSNPSLNTERDSSENGNLSENINKVKSSVALNQEEKIPRLEKVVEKVVGLHCMEHIDDMPQIEKVADEFLEPEKSTDSHSLKVNNDSDKDGQEHAEGQDTETDKHAEEALSPSQSESSRATRWEALADIAAELPPSLTVDPITGQIYALSK